MLSIIALSQKCWHIESLLPIALSIRGAVGGRVSPQMKEEGQAVLKTGLPEVYLHLPAKKMQTDFIREIKNRGIQIVWGKCWSNFSPCRILFILCLITLINFEGFFVVVICYFGFESNFNVCLCCLFQICVYRYSLHR